MGELVLTYRHQLTATGNGGTHIKHTLEITGNGADEIGPELGPLISDDFPIIMAALLATAEHHSTD